jgi:diguanylate cyclase (GGDEF)-like protein
MIRRLPPSIAPAKGLETDIVVQKQRLRSFLGGMDFLSCKFPLSSSSYLGLGHALKWLVTAPTFPDKEKTRAARWLNWLLLALITLISADTIAILLGLLDQDTLAPILIANTIALAANLGILLLMRRGQVRIAALLVLLISLLLITYANAVIFQSIRTSNVMAYFVLIPLNGLLLGRRNMNTFAALCIVTISGIFYFEWAGVLIPALEARSIFDDVAVLFLTLGSNTALLNASIRRVEEKAEEIEQTATALATANRKLQISQRQLEQARAELEQRVEQRTEELRQTNTQLKAEIEERKRAEEQLTHDALHDSLTDLPNRALFLDRLHRAIELAKRYEYYRFSVFFLDFDYFKVINDSLGHTIGDQLLVGIAHRLRMCVGTRDTVARFGGDEFVMLLEDTTEIDSATSRAQQIQEALKKPFYLEGHQVFVTASIGIVSEARAYERAEEALRDADIAMYHAKAQGKARYEVFNLNLREQAMTRLALESELREALERQELELYYQPILSLSSSHIAGFEALLRWHHPRRGLLGPGEFIPIAEETGLMMPMGQWVLATACRQLQAWHARFPSKPHLTMSVNISVRQFAEPNLAEQVEQILQAVGLDGQHLKLEITESAYLDRSEPVMTTFNSLRRMGIQFHVDDFGTGYSSLSYLQDFPIQSIKIDRAFVNRMGESNNQTDIVRAIITMAHDLGMEAIAEGVETLEQLNELKQLGCDYVQGFFLSKPINATKIEALLKESRTALIPQSKSPTPVFIHQKAVAELAR